MKTKKTLILGLACMLTGSSFAATPDVIWTGAAGDSLWNTTSQNWKAGETAAAFADGNSVAFDAGLPVDSVTGVNHRYVLVDGHINAGGVVFDSDFNYTIAAAADSNGVKGDFQFVKDGKGTLTFYGQDFYFWPLQGTWLKKGQIVASKLAATSNNVQEQILGPKVLMEDSTKILMNAQTNDKHGYDNIALNIEVADNATATFVTDRNSLMSGSLTGSKTATFNLGIPYLREHFGGDWSKFEGQLNVSIQNPIDGSTPLNFILCDTFGIAELINDKFVAVYPREGFVIDSTKVKEQGYSYVTKYPLGLPKARVHLNDSIAMFWGSNTGSSPASSMNRNNAVCYIGALTGDEGSFLSATGQGSGSSIHTWYIGGLNTDEVFNGQIITGGYKKRSDGTATHIVKIGTGDWRLTNNHTNKGDYRVNEGSLTMLGSATTTGGVYVEAGASLRGIPTFTAASIAEISGTLEPGDSTIDHGIGTIAFQAANVTFKDGAVLQIGLGQGRNDKLDYYGELSFDSNATIKFFVEENNVMAGDTFRILVPSNNSANATVVSEGKVECVEGLTLNTEHLFEDPQFADPLDRDICGCIIVTANTAKGKYNYASEKPTVKSISPADSSYIGTSGTLTLTFDNDVKLGTGDITLGGVKTEASVEGDVLTLNYEGLAAGPYDLIIPAGSILADFDDAPCEEIRYFFNQDVTAPTLTKQSVVADSVMSWVDFNLTFTYSEAVKVADNSKIKLTTTSRPSYVRAIPSTSGNVLTVSVIAMAYETAYTLEIAEGAITDLANVPAAAITLPFSTKPAVVFEHDSLALNGKDATTLPVMQIPLNTESTNSYPLWAQVKDAASGTFAEGVMTYTAVNSNNKIMCAWSGKEGVEAQWLTVKAYRTGEGEVSLKLQESTGEATPAPWRTMCLLTNDELGTSSTDIVLPLNAKARFIKLLPNTISTNCSIVIEGYTITTNVALPSASSSSLKFYTTNDELIIKGLTAGNRIEVYTLTGLRTSSFLAEGAEASLRLNGMNIVKVYTENGPVVIKAISK